MINVNVCEMKVKVKPGTYEFESALEDWMRRVREEHSDEGVLYYQLQQLYPSSYYQLQVRAMNDVGYSEPNPEFIFSTAAGALNHIDLINNYQSFKMTSVPLVL